MSDDALEAAIFEELGANPNAWYYRPPGHMDYQPDCRVIAAIAARVAEQSTTVKGYVTHVGGGMVTMWIDRDTERYPAPGDRAVLVTTRGRDQGGTQPAPSSTDAAPPAPPACSTPAPSPDA